MIVFVFDISLIRLTRVEKRVCDKFWVDGWIRVEMMEKGVCRKIWRLESMIYLRK